MNTIVRIINRFCARRPNFGVPKLIYIVIAGNVLVFLFSQMSGRLIYDILSFNPALILRGQVWRLVSWVFIPRSAGNDIISLILFFIMIYFYTWLARILEGAWGKAKFNVFYFIGVISHVLYGFAVYAAYYISLDQGQPNLFIMRFLMTSEYLNLSMFLAVALLYPETGIMFMMIIPVKMKWLALVYLGFIAYEVITRAGAARFVPLLTLISVSLVCWDMIMEVLQTLRLSNRFRRIRWERANRTSSEFGGGSRRERGAANTFTGQVTGAGSFRERKCAVCGKPASEYPDMEFRYCSRCAGMHCYCEDHINSHVHFTE